jgi:hypothetical protein
VLCCSAGLFTSCLFLLIQDYFLYEGVEDNEKVGADMQADSGAIPLPDIKQVLRKKFMEEELSRIEEEQEDKTVKIRRTDRKAMAKVRSSIVAEN